MRDLFSQARKDQEMRDELLSAYLDDELSDQERELLEARVTSDAVLQRELEALRRTVTMTRDLPTVSAPRNFILSPSMVEQPHPVARETQTLGWTAPILTAVTATVSLLFIVVLASDLLLGGIGWGGAASAPAVQEEPRMAMETAPVEGPAEAEAERTVVTPTEKAPVAAVQESPDEEEEAEKTEEEQDADSIEARKTAAPPGAGASPLPTSPPVAEEREEVTPSPLLEDAPEETTEEAASDRVDRPPIVLWRALEVTLGLTSIILMLVTIRAWRTRR